jgi:hypothetical protein
MPRKAPRKPSKARKPRKAAPRRKQPTGLMGAILKGLGKVLQEAGVPKDLTGAVIAGGAHVGLAILPPSQASHGDRERCLNCGHSHVEHCACESGACVASVQAMAGMPCACKGWLASNTYLSRNSGAMLLSKDTKHDLCSGKKSWQTGELVLKSIIS